MRKKILLDAMSDEISDNIKKQLRKSTYHFEEVNLHNKMINKNQTEIIFLYCNFQCSLAHCLDKYLFAVANRNIPFIMIRELCLKKRPFSSPIFGISFQWVNCFSQNQLDIINKLTTSKYYIKNLGLMIHPSTVFFKVATLQQEIAENPYETFNLTKLSQIHDISRCWLSRRFREITDLTLEKYITKNKLCIALWDIINTNRLIKEISFNIGYRHASFCKRFKETFGVPPTLIREKLIPRSGIK